MQGYLIPTIPSLFSSAVLIRGVSLLPLLATPSGLLRECEGGDGCCEGAILTRGLMLECGESTQDTPTTCGWGGGHKPVCRQCQSFPTLLPVLGPVHTSRRRRRRKVLQLCQGKW